MKKRPNVYSLSAVRCVLAALALAVVRPAMAGCSWTWDDEQGGWHVDCDFSDHIFIPGEGGGGSGGCSGCVQMSSDDCQAIKDNIMTAYESNESLISGIQMNITQIEAGAQAVIQNANSLMAEGNSFIGYYSIGTVPGATISDRIEYLQGSPMGAYLKDDDPDDPAWLSFQMMTGGTAALYNYYNQSVKPTLLSIARQASSITNETARASASVSQAYDNNESISLEAAAMNCTACGSGSGSGGGGDSGNPSGPSACPCSAFIEAVQTAVVDNGTKLEVLNGYVLELRNRVRVLDANTEIIKSCLASISNDVARIRQSVVMMDDFFDKEYEFGFKALIEHALTLSNTVVNISSNLTSFSYPSILFWSDYTNATHFLDKQEQNIDWNETAQAIKQPTGTMPIDFGEYENLNWFQRIEFLLGEIAGIFTPTNYGGKSDFSSEEQAQFDEVQGYFDGINFDSRIDEIRTQITALQNARMKLNPFSTAFQNASPSRRIDLLPDVSVSNALIPDQRFPAISVDLTATGDGNVSVMNLISWMHSFTTFFWLVTLLIIDIGAFIFFVTRLIALNRWYWNIYKTWAPSLFVYGGKG